MKNRVLRLPCVDESLRRGFLLFMEEAIAEKRWWTAVPAEQIRADFASYVRAMEGFRQGVGLADDQVPWTELWVVDDDDFIGRVSLRHRLNAKLERFGGHIGYEIRRDFWLRGYGTFALQNALPYAWKLGHRRLLVTCDDTNHGSIKIIERCGGVLQDKIQNEGRPAPTRRYWISR